MKKLFAFISLFLSLGIGSAFADVTAKKLADGNVEVTFFYGNPRASEVLLAGDFNNWQNGAEPMTKTDKGFTLTKTFKPTDVLTYKFISDGNWTTDLKAPELVDDGFGGKNSRVTVADFLGGDGDSGAGKAKINFVSWSMIGVQGNFITQGVVDKSNKGKLDLDSVSVGFKSYNKFVGNFLPNCPLYIEIPLSEIELDPVAYGGLGNESNYLYKKDVITAQDGLKQFLTGILTNPAGYLSKERPNDGKKEKGYSPFLGSIKFGFNTPYINYYTGYIDAKTDVRQKVKWTTVGAWNGGYQHDGGYHVFSLGNKAVAALEEKTGISFDIGFAPNKSADRKGHKYGYFGWAGITWNDLVIDFQTNGMYDSDYMFCDPVEHDFILGVKDTFSAGDGKLSFALQGLLSTSQKKIDSDTLSLAGVTETNDNGGLGYFGYSTDSTYRSGEFDGIQNVAADVSVGYNTPLFGANVEYRMRGAQTSMLFVQQNIDDGVFTISDQLGVLNSQNIDFNGYVSPFDALRIDLGVGVTMPLEHIKNDSEIVSKSTLAMYTGGWGADGATILGAATPLYGVKGGAEIAIKPAVTFTITDGMTLGAYADMYINCYDIEDGKYSGGKWVNGFGADGVGDTYGASDSSFLLKYAGLSFNWKTDNEAVKNVGVWYGLDNSNSARLFNTLTAQAELKYGFKATLGFGVRTIKDTEAGDKFDEDANNPFGFALGLSRQFTALKKPILYAQFVYNTDPFAIFGGGQDQLRMNRSNLTNVCDNNGIGRVTAVNFYEGRAALRLGIRWDI